MGNPSSKQRLLIMLMYLALTPFAYASTSDDAFIIVGAAVAPEYMGSDDNSTVPMIISEFNVGNRKIIIEGLDIEARFYQTENWHIGIAGNIDTGRDDDVDDDRVARLEEIDTAVNLGLSLTYEKSDHWLTGDEFSLSIKAYGDASSTHKGNFITTSASYTLPMLIPWRFEFELESTYADSRYLSTYFGISDNDAIASGLASFSPSSGFRDISIATNIGLFFNPKWGVFTRLSMTRLLDDAADSPITERGKRNQYFAGVGVFYRF